MPLLSLPVPLRFFHSTWAGCQARYRSLSNVTMKLKISSGVLPLTSISVTKVSILSVSVALASASLCSEHQAEARRFEEVHPARLAKASFGEPPGDLVKGVGLRLEVVEEVQGLEPSQRVGRGAGQWADDLLHDDRQTAPV